MTMHRVHFEPMDVVVEVRPGTSLLEAARKGNVTIRTRCAGVAGCLMCKVTAEDQSGLSPLGRAEQQKLGSQTSRGIRLACQARVQGDVTVQVPEDPLKAAIRAQLAKQKEEDTLW
ncbi:2Fe-2S iron-sulfur cluster-binding protein [Gorillibacterium timonense]|uniref:2Fe-2S iron-sulfur cluster-binding protein n=1 Tax=Gorillibacterium timonense TaxID=1689269 RepID=UPI00071D18AD|nr:2Fe-2S iron-sulfur cluster-binding protein [Gorillibacterium timonense]